MTELADLQLIQTTLRAELSAISATSAGSDSSSATRPDWLRLVRELKEVSHQIAILDGSAPQIGRSRLTGFGPNYG